MIARKSTINDLPELVKLGQEFMDETRWGWTYSPDNALRSYYTHITHPECDIIQVNDENGVLLGAAMVSIENDFQVENVGDINEFYVSAKARGTGASRVLMQALCDWFDEMKCINVFVKATANVGNDQAFINLFNKYGFKVFSQVLVR